MGFPFFVSLPEDARPPDSQHAEDDPLLVKYVELKEQQGCVAHYKEIEDSLMVRHLVNSRGQHALEQLMIVSFHTKDTNFIIETLQRGIECNGSQYHYLGQSRSQLKNKTCYLMNASVGDLHDLLANFDNFDDMVSAARRSKKIASLFSPFARSLELKAGEYDVIDDVTNTLGTYVFTDGCGLMSSEFAQEVQKLHNLPTAPSVVEVRFRGFGGVLVRFDRMPSLRVKALFRNSMADLVTPPKDLNSLDTLGVVGYSQPYSLGYLDTLTVMLLAEGGVPHEYLLTLETKYYDLLENLEEKTYASYFLRTTGHENTLRLLQEDGLTKDIMKILQQLRIKEIEMMEGGERGNSKEEKENHLQQGMLDELQKERDTNLKAQAYSRGESEFSDKEFCSIDGEGAYQLESTVARSFQLRILVPEAREVFGVSDPYGQLKSGECFFQPTLPATEANDFAFAEHVVVIRRPSYHVGDLRVLKLAHDKEMYKDLFDCIVFPVRGVRPHANLCNGGRVGGDKYFVCWDQKLIPHCVGSPYVGYISSSCHSVLLKVKEMFGDVNWKCKEQKPLSDLEEKKKQRQGHQALIEYFGNFTSCEELRARATELFLKSASSFGSSCSECEQIKKLFAGELDWNEHYDHVKKKLDKVEADYEKEVKTLAMFPRTRQAPSSFDRLLVSLQWKRPPFCPGDDVWNRMKERGIRFVVSQTT